jgi:hypothetical protein
MAKIRNKSGVDLDVPGLGVVPADGIAEVPDARLLSFTCQPAWEPVRKADQELHDQAVAAQAKVADVAPPPEVGGVRG